MQTNSGTTYRKRALMMAAVALVIVFILWNIPQLSILLFPFRLFVTFVHEAGHGLAAILTQGRFVEFTINANGSGLAQTIGGNRALILMSGYLGAAFFGAALFYLTHSVPYPRHLSVVLGVAVIAVAALFGGIFSLATLFGAVIGIALIAVGLRGSRDVNLVLLNVLAILTGLNAILDLFYLTGNTGVAMGATRNDALAFQSEVAPLIPASIWALVWSALALLMLGAALYFSIIHPLRKRKKEDMPTI